MAQRQFRSDDTSTWGEQYGNGQDGAYAPSSETDAPIDSACTGTAAATSLTATNASFATGQVILIHQTAGTGAGNWELNTILSYVEGTITTKYPLINTYATGAQVLVLKQYTSALIDTGVTLTAKAWDGTVGGIIGWLCSGMTTVTGTLTAAGKGYRGGVGGSGVTTGIQGESSSGTPGSSGLANGQGGGGGANIGDHATGGGTAGVAGLTTLFFGGGAGGANNSSSTVEGGDGGGIVVIISKHLVVTGSLTAGGTAGASGTFSGGSGAGGSILTKSKTLTLGSSLVVAGGAASTAGSSGAGNGAGGGHATSGGNGSNSGGGAGGSGRIHADYLSTLTGTTSPTIDSRQDAVLADRGGAFFNFLM